MEALRGSGTFAAVLSVLLAVGNYLNGSQCKGFQLEYLSKVSIIIQWAAVIVTLGRLAQLSQYLLRKDP